MGQAERTTKLLLDFSEKEKGGANRSKRAALSATSEVLNQARGFYLDFFLAHPEKLFERVQLVNKETGEVREAVISADKLLTWAEYQTVSTPEHPHPSPRWNFSTRFPDVPWEYRRSAHQGLHRQSQSLSHGSRHLEADRKGERQARATYPCQSPDSLLGSLFPPT